MLNGHPCLKTALGIRTGSRAQIGFLFLARRFTRQWRIGHWANVRQYWLCPSKPCRTGDSSTHRASQAECSSKLLELLAMSCFNAECGMAQFMGENVSNARVGLVGRIEEYLKVTVIRRLACP